MYGSVIEAWFRFSEIFSNESLCFHARFLFSFFLPKALWEDQEDVVKLLVMTGNTDINERDRFQGGSCFHYAARNGNVNLINFFFEKGAALYNEQDDNGQTPLFVAVERELADVVRALLAHNVEVSTPDSMGNTPLHVAVELGNSELVKLLVKAGANMDYRNEAGYSPFHLALASGNHKMAFYLINNNSDPNLATFDGTTPLHTAIEVGSFKWISVLVENGADINTPNGDGATPFDFALAYKRPQAIDFLRKRQAAKGTGIVSIENRDEE